MSSQGGNSTEGAEDIQSKRAIRECTILCFVLFAACKEKVLEQKKGEKVEQARGGKSTTRACHVDIEGRGFGGSYSAVSLSLTMRLLSVHETFQKLHPYCMEYLRDKGSENESMDVWCEGL